jgi:putative hydrolase of the HAD superfamily
VSAGAYRAVLFDLFGTLVTVDAGALPVLELDGRRMPATLGRWAGLIEEALPGIGVERFARALLAASAELDRERRETEREFPSRERFRRALARLGCDRELVAELAARCARAHMAVIAEATRFPPEHARILREIAHRRRVAVVTNFDDTATGFDILRRHGILEHAGSVVVSEAVGLRKPHPALVRLALVDLAVGAGEAVLVGDHAVEDVGAAVRAGVDAIWIDAAGGPPAPGDPVPRYTVRTLVEAAALLG